MNEHPGSERNLRETVWERHSNPKSGWSRLLSWPVFVIAVYLRNRRLAVLVMLFGVLNPVLFREPDEEMDSWMYRVVQAEKQWTDDGNRLIGVGYPQILNSIGFVAMLYGLAAAYKQRPVSAAVWTLIGLGMGQWCMKVIIENYETTDLE